MCHPWLAAGVTCFVAFLLVLELTPVVRAGETRTAALESGLPGVRLRGWVRARIAPERYVILELASMSSAVAAHLVCQPEGHQSLVIGGICLVAILAQTTAIQRVRSTLRRLP
jgi:hypothetical protein